MFEYFSTRIYKSFEKNDGISLIEVSIIILILGMLAVPFAALYKAELKSSNVLKTVGNFNDISDTINNYYRNGADAFPCPASLTAQLGDADFGIQALNCDLTNITDCDDPTWVNNQGVCKTSSNPSDAVIIGGVPFTDLKISQGKELDPWNNKLIYAVTFNRTQPATFNNGDAIAPFTQDNPASAAFDGIPDQLEDNAGNDVFHQFIIFSTGRNGLGGFTKDGTRTSDCPNPTNELSELENCDFDNVFLLREDPDLRDTSVASDGALPYDDFTSSQSFIEQTVWYKQTNSSTDARTLAKRIGIGTPDPQEALHVSDRRRIEDSNMLIESRVNQEGLREGGQLKGNNICSYDENDNRSCFSPRIIAGDVEDMRCTGVGVNAVRRLSDNRVTCTGMADANGNDLSGDVLSVEELSGGCSRTNNQGDAIGEPAIGFNANGEIQCD